MVTIEGPSQYDRDRDTTREENSEEESPVRVSRTSTSALRELISEEVAKAQEKSLPLLLGRITETIRDVVADEFQRRDKEMGSNRPPTENVAHGEQPVVNVREERQKLAYKDFMACKPPEYQGESDPIKCFRWMSEVEGAFDISE